VNGQGASARKTNSDAEFVPEFDANSAAPPRSPIDSPRPTVTPTTAPQPDPKSAAGCELIDRIPVVFVLCFTSTKRWSWRVSNLSGFEWGVIQPLLPNNPRRVAQVDDRRILRTGSPLRDLPERYDPPATIYIRFNRWTTRRRRRKWGAG
jgi:hypothetical protein